MVDDLNDCIEGMGGHAQALTPHMNRLGESGASFLRAYTNAPMCGPSRSSMFTGVFPHQSHNYFQAPWVDNDVLINTRTMMEQFKVAGYNVMGTGKILHHNKLDIWSHFENAADYGPSPFNGEERVPHPDVPNPFSEIGWVDGSLGPFVNLEGRTTDKGKPLSWTTGNGGNLPYKPMRYKNDEQRGPTPDEQNANWAASTIKHFSKFPQKEPFFMAVGFLRPHTPLVAPQKYFDLFPLEEIKLAVIKPSDDTDTHLKAAYQGNVFTLKMGERMYKAISKAYGSSEMGLKKWTQAYLACVAAVDDNIGQVLDALDESPLKDNTIVVLASDHGFHMGEKDYLYKNSLWEESTRIPLMMKVPGLTKPGIKVEHPVSLIDVYPTLLDLCNISMHTIKNEKGHPLDGHSMRSLLKNPATKKWKGPKAALTVVYAGPAHERDPTMQHYTIRTQHYRYILYNNGQEELYDHRKDPYEWQNLAGQSGSKKRLKKMRRQLKCMVQPHQLVGFTKQKSS
jgi:arylsulfatase A-like enzyme